MPLTKQTFLQRAPDLEVSLRSNTNITLALKGKTARGNLHTLAILDTFATPKTLQAGVDELVARTPGQVAWVDLVSHITALYEHGSLHDPGQQTPLWPNGSLPTMA